MFSFNLEKSILARLHSSFITFKHLTRSHYNGADCVPMHSFTVLTYAKSKAFCYKWNESTSTSIIGHFEKMATCNKQLIMTFYRTFRARNAVHLR